MPARPPDHNPMPRDDFDNWRMRDADLMAYIAGVEQARKDHPELTILAGLEVDYIPGYEDWIRQLAGRYDWDYFIGSVHYLSDSWAIDNPNAMFEWNRRDPMEVWTAYFDRLTDAARSGLFDLIGHPDLCKRFCFYPKADCTGLFRNFLRAAREHGVAIEINTAGLRKDCREMYPSPAFLQLAAEEGVALSFGADAHAPRDVGASFQEAVALARSVGYSQSCRFRKRRRALAPL
jgi:histidinol-phosphatase (PHP family)